MGLILAAALLGAFGGPDAPAPAVPLAPLPAEAAGAPADDPADDLEARWLRLGETPPSPRRAREAVALLEDTLGIRGELSAEELRLVWDVGVQEALALRFEDALGVQEALYALYPAAWSASDLELTLRRLGRYGEGDAVLAAQIAREEAAGGSTSPVAADLWSQRGIGALGSGDERRARDYLGAGCARGSADACVVLARLDLAVGRLEEARAGFRALLVSQSETSATPPPPASPWAARGWGLSLLPDAP